MQQRKAQQLENYLKGPSTLKSWRWGTHSFLCLLSLWQKTLLELDPC